MRIAFTTLGCKINQFETDALRRDLQSHGNTVVPFESEADVYIINTCSVTAKSDYQSRQVIRSAIRRGNGAKVIVTGCYASTRPDEIRSIPGVDLVVDNSDKKSIPFTIMDHASTPTEKQTPAAEQTGRTRRFLKIQDGCDNRCSYCIVPLARGSSRSMDRGDVIREFDRLVQAGCPEIVLTGIHVGMYGVDLDSGTNLTQLMKTLLSRRGAARIRLSSIEPNEITDEIIGMLGHGLCRHLHIPLQSGDDTILKSMKRSYTSSFYRDILGKIAQQAPGVALGADVMVGFPGEGEREFENTLELVRQSPLTHLHVFSYSPRPGTPAADMKNQVPEAIKKERSERLRRIASAKNLEFRTLHLNLNLSIVIEGTPGENTQKVVSGISDNYIRVHVQGDLKEADSKEISVKIAGVTELETIGHFIKKH